jgi:hypothetical protein
MMVLFSFLLWANGLGWAIDYSGCIPRSPTPGAPPSYQISREGRLVFQRNSPDLIRSDSSSSKDSITFQRPNTTNTHVTQELFRENGRPVRLVESYPLFGNQNPQRAKSTSRFAYENGRCVLAQMELEYSHGSDAKKKLVTFDRRICARMDEVAKQMGRDLELCRSRFIEARDYLVAEDEKLRQGGRQLFGFKDKRMEENPFDTILNTTINCRQIQAMYGRENPQSPGSFWQGLFSPGEQPARDTGTSGAN